MKGLLQIRVSPYPWSRATPSPRLFHVGLLLLGVLLLGACARSPKPVAELPPPPPQPSPQSVPAPSSSTGGIRLLKDAQEHQSRGEYASAIQKLQAFLDSQPTTSLFLEAQTALARTYEQSENFQEALQAYREVAKRIPARSSGTIRQHTQERIAFLEARTELGKQGTRRSVVVMIPASALPPRKQWDHWLDELQKAGVTIVVLEAGTKSVRSGHSSMSKPRAPTSKSSGPSPGVYFQTTWAPVLKPALNQIVPLAHRKGMAVFAAVTLRRMPWLEPPVGWADWVYRLNANRLERSQALDLFNPAVQDYHAGFLADLVKTGIDGVLFQANVPMGPFEGLSRFGLEGFRRQYGIQLNARILFPPPAQASRPSKPEQSSPDGLGKPEVTSRFSPAYWKWEGWKVRERLEVIGRHMNRLRKQVPAIQFAMEVHVEAITKPMDALLHFSEDVMEAKQLGFHYLVTPMGASGSRPMRLSDNSSTESNPVDSSETNFMQQALAIMEGPERIWVMHNLPNGQAATIGQVLPVRRDQLPLPKGVGLLYTFGRPVLP